MEILVKRNEPLTHTFTHGKLYVDGQFLCYTLEDEVREIEGLPVEKWKVKGVTAIPRGRYRVILTKSPRFGRMLPEVLNVPGYQNIRIHSGNRSTDTEACILVGMQETGIDWIGNSREAEGLVVADIQESINAGEQVWLTVE